MKKYLAVAALVFAVGGWQLALAQSNGNPRPGFPHDTIIIHVQKASSGAKLCDGGHSLFLRYYPTATGGLQIPADTLIHITMTDWVDWNNDGNATYIDASGNVQVDPGESGGITTALDCDSYGDNLIKLQIRDADPDSGEVSVQEWFMRMIGKPNQNFAFTSYANQTISCTADDGADDTWGTSDDVVTCVSVVPSSPPGTTAEWVHLADFNLADGVDGVECVKQVKGAGGGGNPKGGKTPFCDITKGFKVNVDGNGDGDVTDPYPTDELNRFVFSVSCLDDPGTPYDETLYCPLSSVIWDIDETSTDLKAQVQIFVAHTASASVRTGKVVKP